MADSPFSPAVYYGHSTLLDISRRKDKCLCIFREELNLLEWQIFIQLWKIESRFDSILEGCFFLIKRNWPPQ